MDIIDRAMAKGKHFTNDEKIRNQTWNDFLENCKRKNLVIFGAGEALKYMLLSGKICEMIKKYIININIIDSDSKKHNVPVEWLYSEAVGTCFENIVVESPNILCRYINQDTVYLITLMNGYEELMLDLRKKGFDNCYSMLIMECNYRSSGYYDNAIDDHKLCLNYVNEFSKLELVNNKIVMWYGEYGTHVKYITEKLREIRQDLDIVWLVNSYTELVPWGIRLVFLRNMRSYIYELETAKIWIWEGANISTYIKKRCDQIYIQVKHWSSITLKKFYLEDKSNWISSKITASIKYNGQMMDYIFTGSMLDEESCRRGFAYSGPMIRLGSARTDILFKEGIKSQVYGKLNLELDVKTILYAPTFRKDNVSKGSKITYIPDIKNVLRTVKEKFEGKWIILIKLHPWIKLENSDIIFNNDILNVCDYPDSQELVAASDIMITDYSSIMFEPAFVRKPVFLFAPDRKEYIDKERGLLIDYDTLPFPIAETNDELAQNIAEFDNEKYIKDVDAFMEKYGVHEDGHASERAAKFISNLIDGKKE